MQMFFYKASGWCSVFALRGGVGYIHDVYKDLGRQLNAQGKGGYGLYVSQWH